MIKVLEKAALLLRLIGDRPGIRPGELATAAELHKATLSNILKTLTALGQVRRDTTGGCHTTAGRRSWRAVDSMP